jgi:hypothetical protein
MESKASGVKSLTANQAFQWLAFRVTAKRRPNTAEKSLPNAILQENQE